MISVEGLDQGTLFAFERLHRPWLDRVVPYVSHVGDAGVLHLAALVAAVLFMARGRWRAAAFLLLVTVFSFFLGETVKGYVLRTRPDVAWRLGKLPSSGSFPSGHALNSLCVYGAIALLLARGLRSRFPRAVVLVVGFGLPLLIGLSRLYVAHHWPTDVLGGWDAGLACALTAYWADRRWGTAELESASAKGRDALGHAGK